MIRQARMPLLYAANCSKALQQNILLSKQRQHRATAAHHASIQSHSGLFDHLSAMDCS